MKSSLSSSRNIAIILIGSIIVLSSIYVIRYQSIEFGEEHVHAKFKVYINTQQINFNSEIKPQYHNANEAIFLDGQNGHTIHRFVKDTTLGDFFTSIGMTFTSTCFVLDEPLVDLLDGQTEFCNEGDKTLKFLVNNILNNEYENYIIKEGDRFLITFGDQTDKVVDSQMATVSGTAYTP